MQMLLQETDGQLKQWLALTSKCTLITMTAHFHQTLLLLKMSN